MEICLHSIGRECSCGIRVDSDTTKVRGHTYVSFDDQYEHSESAVLKHGNESFSLSFQSALCHS